MRDRELAGRTADDDLDLFIREHIEESPSFAAAYCDAMRRTELICALTTRRKAAGLRQEDVAAAMSTTQSCISDLESGETDPHLSTVQRYARAVGVGLGLTIQNHDRVVERMTGARSQPKDWRESWRQTVASMPTPSSRVA